MRGTANDVEATGRVLLLPPTSSLIQIERGQLDTSRLNEVSELQTDL